MEKSIFDNKKIIDDGFYYDDEGQFHYVLADTKFIFATNFAGNPEQDKYGDSRHKANIIINNPKVVQMMIDAGANVRSTKPRMNDDPSDFTPEYFVTVIAKYRRRLDGRPVRNPSQVYLMSNGTKRCLTEETIGLLDDTMISKVDCTLTPYRYDPNKDAISLNIDIMYVKQRVRYDPFASDYDDGVEEDPF